MRKHVALLALVMMLFCCKEAPAVQLPYGKSVVITLSDTYASRYISKGQDAYPDNDSSNHPSIDVTFPKLFMDTDLSFNAWGAMPLAAGHQQYVEVDYSTYLTRDIGKDWNVVVGYVYYDYPNASRSTDTSDPWATVTLKKIPYLPVDISAYATVYYEFPVVSGAEDPGIYYTWGFETDVPLPAVKIFQKDQALTLKVANWGTDGVGGRKPSIYATELGISTDYSFGKITVSPSVHYVLNQEETINEGKDEVWAEFGVNYKF